MHKVGKLEAYPTLVSASISAVSGGVRAPSLRARLRLAVKRAMLVADNAARNVSVVVLAGLDHGYPAFAGDVFELLAILAEPLQSLQERVFLLVAVF